MARRPPRARRPAEVHVAHHISVALRDFCAARGLSTYEAAAAAGMSQGALYNVIRGRSWPNSSVIARIERELGVVLWPPRHNPDLRLRPKDYLHSGVWPYGGLAAGAPPEAKIAQTISERFHTAFSRFDDVADAAGKLDVSQGSVEALLHGTAWLDWPTIARVERNLNTRIWVPQQH